MRCITLTQPWATLVAIGAKKIETRSWPTSYRGPIAIHAAKGLGPVGGPSGLLDLCLRDPFHPALRAAGLGFHAPDDGVPLGAIVATARIAHCYPSERAEKVVALHGAEHEWAFGDYSPRRFLWILTDVVALPEPFPVRGALGLWDWTPPEGLKLG